MSNTETIKEIEIKNKIKSLKRERTILLKDSLFQFSVGHDTLRCLDNQIRDCKYYLMQLRQENQK